ncbi:MAG: Rnase Y domain-containing protein, partial [Bacteroidota bacterium]
MGILQIFVLIILVLVLGILLGRIASKLFYTHEAQQSEQRARAIIKDAKAAAAKIKRDKLTEAKEKFHRLK